MTDKKPLHISIVDDGQSVHVEAWEGDSMITDVIVYASPKFFAEEFMSFYGKLKFLQKEGVPVGCKDVWSYMMGKKIQESGRRISEPCQDPV